MEAALIIGVICILAAFLVGRSKVQASATGLPALLFLAGAVVLIVDGIVWVAS